jgi:hypothetical protein
MNIQERWEKALKRTEIIRPRVHPLDTFGATRLPYIFLAGSAVNPGDTVVRKGEVLVEKPSLILPFNTPKFEGFEFEEKLHLNPDFLMSFLLVRGVVFPSLKYNNRTDALEVFEGKLGKAIEHYGNLLQRSEDVQTGLLAGTEDNWQFSVLFFICGQVARSADSDVKKLFEDYRKKSGLAGLS